jgi:hypothetical protein
MFYRNVLSAGRIIPDTSTLINTILLHKKNINFLCTISHKTYMQDESELFYSRPS